MESEWEYVEGLLVGKCKRVLTLSGIVNKMDAENQKSHEDIWDEKRIWKT